MLTNPYQAYQQNMVGTVSPEQLVLMLYNGALRFLKQAQKSIMQHNIEETHSNLVKAQDIISELMLNLDMSQGEIAASLHALYDYMHRRLLDANMKKDIALLEEVAWLLTELRDTWKTACRLK
ncbi:MAG TPA: flagellar export chaperone FliS [Firmicutes bacterium]|nr:flagellar export chaperone FliS [Bacillota bacterium]